jgi:hypothetical protein
MRVAGWWLLLAVASPRTAPAQQADGAIKVGTGTDIHARIEIQHAVYAPGDTACVRVTLVNTSDGTVGYEAMGASDMIHLIIRRNGRLVRPNVEPAGSASAQSARLTPHASWPLANGQWVPLTYWGYELESAGGYTIEGIPQISSAWKGEISDTVTLRSNTVAFALDRASTTHASCRVQHPPASSHRFTQAEMKALSDSVRSATIEKFRAMVDTGKWRHDSTQ